MASVRQTARQAMSKSRGFNGVLLNDIRRSWRLGTTTRPVSLKIPPGMAEDITQLLLAWNEGDAQALDRLMPLVHHELHLLAHRYMAGERPGHPLQTTALVNEAYLRLVDSSRVRWQSRAHFFAVSAHADAAHPGRRRPRAQAAQTRR